jgi:short-subunit dehydrogenase
MESHFWASLHTTLAVLPSMRLRKSGRIVNISSIGGKVSVPHLLPYCVSKFALTGLSEGLRAELLEDGIYVTTVIPGLMRTGSPRHAQFKGQHRAEHAWFALSDSLPGISMSAERAARKIVDGFRYGEAEVTLGLPAWLAARFHGLFPGMTADLLGLVHRGLPGPGGIGKERVKGMESGSWVAPSVATTLTQRAARRNNEMAPQEQEAAANP